MLKDDNPFDTAAFHTVFPQIMKAGRVITTWLA